MRHVIVRHVIVRHVMSRYIARGVVTSFDRRLIKKVYTLYSCLIFEKVVNFWISSLAVGEHLFDCGETRWRWTLLGSCGHRRQLGDEVRTQFSPLFMLRRKFSYWLHFTHSVFSFVLFSKGEDGLGNNGLNNWCLSFNLILWCFLVTLNRIF